MKYRKFLKELPAISEIGMGTWQLGDETGWQKLSEKEALGMLAAAIDFGVNFFDTAPNYGFGTAEIRLGKALQMVDRSRIVINTKFGHTDTGLTDFSASHIRKSLEGSLRRLQTDYVDSLIIHNPPVRLLDGQQNDHYEVLERLTEEGKILAYGASIDNYAEMKLLLDTTSAKVVEAFFNILHQDVARGFGMALEKKVSIIAKIPLDSGWLSGKYDANTIFEGVRSRWTRHDIQNRAHLVGRLKALLDEPENLAQLAIAFCLGYEAVCTVIPGSLSIGQLKMNAESGNNLLADQLMRRLEAFWTEEVRPFGLPW